MIGRSLDDATSGETNDLTIVNKFNSAGDLIEVKDAYGNKAFTTYNDYGAPTSQTDTFGNTTINDYDQYTGNLTYTSDNYGNSTTLTYDEDGNVKTSKDRNGNLQFSATYNSFGEITTVTPGQGRSAEIRYNENGDAVARWSLDGEGASQVQLLSITYYDDERKATGSISAKLPSGQFITSGFETATIPEQHVTSRSSNLTNPIGQAVAAIDNYGLRNETTYDINGRVVQTRSQTRKASATGGEEVAWMVTRSLYDSAGRVIAQTDSYVEGSTGPVRGTRTVYDSAGRVEKTYQVTGLVIDLVGPSANVLEAVLNTVGTTLTNTTSSSTFDSAGRVIQSTDAYGRTSTTTYNLKGSVTETRQQTYDQTGALKYLISRTAYDSFGRAILSTDSYIEGSTAPVFGTETLYDATGRSTGSIRRSGITINLTGAESTIGSLGSIVSQTSTHYDSQGRAFKQVSADGQISLTEFDSRGRTVASIGMHVEVAKVGLTPPSGVTHARPRSETVYDVQGRAHKSITGVIEWGTLVAGQFVRATNPDGTPNFNRTNQRITEQFYDEQGRVIEVKAPDGTSTRTQYDQLGRVKKEIDQLNNEKDFTYNSSGQLVSLQLPAVLNPLNNNALTRPTYYYQYNEFGQMSKLTDAKNNATNFGFSSTGRSTNRTLPNGQVETFAYDTRQRQYLHVSFEGVHKVTVYDDSAAGGGRVQRQEYFLSLPDYNAYLNAATMQSTTIKWERIAYQYDAQGRVVTTTHSYIQGFNAQGNPRPLPAPQPLVDTWTNTYDAQGRVTQETSPTGVIGYEYDPLGRKSRTWAGGVGATAATALSDITYEYDELGRLKTVNTVKRDGSIVDTNGSTAGTPPETTAYRYDILGRPDYTVMPNEIVEDFTFDNMDRLDVMRHFASDSDNGNLANNPVKDIFDYSYRADGKRTGLVETFKLNGADKTTTYTWGYDAAGRLTSEAIDHWVGNDTPPPNLADDIFDQTESYIMDLVGNRLRRTTSKSVAANNTTDIYTYDASDRLLTENRYAGLHPTGTPGSAATQTTTYAWTATQQTTKTVAVPTVSSVVQTMTYGLTGQLEKVITTNSTGSTVQSRKQVEYRYDNSGIRFIAIDTTDTNLGTPAVDGASTGRTEYLIDHANFTGYAQTIIESKYERDDQQVERLVKRISYTFGTDEITQTTSDINPTTGAVTGTPVTLTFGHDGHGSTRALFGAAAAIMQVLTYTAYGELLAIHNGTAGIVSGSASTLANPSLALTNQLYNGEGIDNRTGLYNFRARWYSASNGRFERLDPYAGNPNDPFSFNKYGFTSGDPILFSDPTGMFEGLGGMLGSMSIGSMMQGLNAYAIKTAVHSAGETLIEGAIASLISGLFGIKNEFDVDRSFTTNFASNFLTGGLSSFALIQRLFQFVIRTVADIAYGESVGWAVGINSLVLGGPALASMGAKIIDKYFPKALVTKITMAAGENSATWAQKLVAEYAKRVPRLAGYSDVFVHGTRDGKSFAVIYNGAETIVDHRIIASWLQSKGITGDIRLISCYSGMLDTGSVAQHLSNKLGVKVMAPTDAIVVNSNGMLTAPIGTVWKLLSPGG